MSYTALYRKYRPASFDDVKGQDHIVTTLRNQIMAGRIGHAYLFCGTRGTGKTTVAKIFARAVNCENPINGSACGECPTCKAIAGGMALNIFEIDAASNNGVENIRNLIDEVSYSPTIGRYKVYIIDEAHMITQQAFNALLKTLEEPPAYVIFVMATTDPHKILTTILSRCQRYDFHRITIDTIKERLEYICRTENLDVEDRAIRYIARMGDGSMRDSLSLLDQCVGFHLGEKLTYDDTLDILGAVDAGVFDEILRAISADDVVEVMRLLERVVEQGRELLQFTTDLIWYIRCVMLLQTESGLEEVIDLNTEDMARLKETAAKTDPDAIMHYIRVLSELTSQFRYSSQKRILLEVTLIRLCKYVPGETPADITGNTVARTSSAQTTSVQKSSPQAPGGEDAYYAAMSEGYVADDQAVIPSGPVNTANTVELGEFNIFRDKVRQRIESLEDMRRRLETLESRVKSGGALVTEPEEAAPPPLPEALPEDIEDLIKRWPEFVSPFEGATADALRTVKKSITEDGRLMLVFNTSDFSEAFAAKRYASDAGMKELTDAIAAFTGKQMEFEVRSESTTQAVETKYVDLDSFVNGMDIVEEDGPREGFGIYDDTDQS